MILFVIMLQLSVSSCSKDDATTDAQKENTNKDGEKKSEGETVVINDDGTTSNGAKYVAIDQNNFYLDDIKYSVSDGHLAVSGHSEEFSGDAKIYPNITFKGTSYDVLEIGENAFSSILTKLTSITIPNSVTTIGSGAFAYCSRLEKVKCMSVTPPQIDSSTFGEIDNAAKLFVPMGAENTYRNADVWKDVFHEIVGE